MTNNLLTPAELAALSACVEVGQDGPADIFYNAELALRKLKNPVEWEHAKQFHQTFVTDYTEGNEYTFSQDFIKGLIWAWYVTAHDFYGMSFMKDTVDKVYDFFIDILRVQGFAEKDQ